MNLVEDKKEAEPKRFKAPRIIDHSKAPQPIRRHNKNKRNDAQALTMRQLDTFAAGNNTQNVEYYISVFVAAKSDILFSILLPKKEKPRVINGIAFQKNILEKNTIKTIRRKTIKSLNLMPHSFASQTPKHSDFSSKMSDSEILQVLNNFNDDINKQTMEHLYQLKSLLVRPYIKLAIHDATNLGWSATLLLSSDDMKSLRNIREGSFMKMYNFDILKMKNTELLPLTFPMEYYVSTKKPHSQYIRSWYHWNMDFPPNKNTFPPKMPCDAIGLILKNEVSEGNGNYSHTLTVQNLFGNPHATIQIEIIENSYQRYWDVESESQPKPKDIIIIKALRKHPKKKTYKTYDSNGKVTSSLFYCYTDVTTSFILADDFPVNIQTQKVQTGFKTAMQKVTNRGNKV